MLIRHISIPRHSHLVPLSEPKSSEPLQQSSDYASYFTKTLNPELPISNTLTSQRQGRLNQSGKQIIDNSFSRELHEKQLSRQAPQRIDEISTDLLFSPKKQNYKHRSWQIDNPEKNHKINQLKNRFPTFSSYIPQLNNNAYLSDNNQPYPQIDQKINNFSYLQAEPDQSQQVINNKHFNRMHKNREVYRTLQKFKIKNKSDEIECSRVKSHKKYTFDPPKQHFAYPEPEINEPLQKQVERKQTKLQPISNKNVKPYVSNPSLSQRPKKMMPQQQEETQNRGIIFPKQRRKSSSLRKTSEQEITPIFTPKSQIHLSSKKLKERSPMKKTVQKLETSNIEISYRTSLTRVRQICEINSIQNYNIIMKIPEIFAYPLFSGNQSQQELFSKADEALKHLQIARKEISLKKYSNCVVILTGSIGVIWHYNGRVYFGGWKNQILDEGAKHGLGLEWVPKKYVYYGEFNKNKREGVGIMKTSQNQILAGLWRDNHFIKSLVFNTGHSPSRAVYGHHFYNE